MARQKFRPTRPGGFSGVKAYISYVKVLKNRRNAVGRTFCDAIFHVGDYMGAGECGKQCGIKLFFLHKPTFAHFAHGAVLMRIATKILRWRRLKATAYPVNSWRISILSGVGWTCMQQQLKMVGNQHPSVSERLRI